MRVRWFSRLLLLCLVLPMLLCACDDASETGASETKRIAFTFDDGPHGTYTKMIVDKAAELGGKVTFFIVGTQLLRTEQTKEAFLYAAEKGAEIGIHAFTHTNSYHECDEDTYLWELRRTEEVARELLPNITFSLMRPVGGQITEQRIAASSYAVIHWSIDTRDWECKGAETEEEQQQNVDKIVQSILKDAKDGSIVLMHDMYENSYLAFCRAADILTKQGYTLVTVSELLGDEREAGKIYYGTGK